MDSVEITLWKIKPNKILELIEVLKKDGIVANIDFEWQYVPYRSTWTIKPVADFTEIHRHVILKFFDGKKAVLFSLKYVDYIKSITGDE